MKCAAKADGKAEKKLDLFAGHKSEYVAKAAAALVETKPAVYLAIEGSGEPGGKAFEEAIGALYGIAFTVKMRRKFAGLGDYAIGKMEAQWPQCMAGGTLPDNRALWQWRIMIRTPEFVAAEELVAAAALQIQRGKSPRVREVELFPLDEGLCAQILHTGSYGRECESVAKMQALAESKGLHFTGVHHEIYLSDPRRVAEEKLRTILRCPVGKN
jgi:hypothetical protein